MQGALWGLLNSQLHRGTLRSMLGPFRANPSMAKLFESPRYIAVEGPIRVGKTTLARILAERMHAQEIIEPEHNPFLAPF